MRLVHFGNCFTELLLLALVCSCGRAWVPAATPVLTTSSRSIAIASAVKLQAISNSSSSHQDEAATLDEEKTASRVGDFKTEELLDLEAELDSLQRDLKVQKGAYEQQLHLLEEESQFKVQEAQDSLAAVMSEYETYKAEMLAKLAAAPSSQEAARMKRELAELQERTSLQESKLATLKKQLLENRQAREGLQAEMVALREGYVNRLAELEDALELEQNERMKIQKDMPQKLEKLEREFRQRLKDTVEESKLHAEQMTANFTGQLEQRDQLLLDAKAQLQQTEKALEERRLTLSVLEGERQSLRKLLAATIRLLRQRVSNRISKKTQQQQQEDEGK